MKAFQPFAALILTSSVAFAQDFSPQQIDAVESFWDRAFACAEDAATCADVGPAVRVIVSAGLCPVENRFEPCEPGSIELPETGHTESQAQAAVATPIPPTASAAAIIPPSPTGLIAGEPEWQAAIARDECLLESGFGPCHAYSPPRLAANGYLYQGLAADETRLLTRWHVYVIECRGATGQENIAGWCAARDQAKDALANLGLCLYAEPINGFRSCAPAGSTPETVPFDDDVMRAAFSALPASQRKFIQGLTSAGGTDGGYGPRTAEALRRTARLLEDLTARDPEPYRFDLSSAHGAEGFITTLQKPLTEAIIWGGH